MRYSTSALGLELIIVAALIAASTCIAAEEANLLLNGGAEQGKKELPSCWSKAAIPADGLKMYRDDKQAHSGRFSLAISNTHEYAQATSNNWAQNIVEVPAGKVVRLSAYIKTKDADAANVCLQCWGLKDEMLAFASTPIVRGDQDWILMRAEPIVVPPETTYMCIRTALTGLGKAWFDEVSVSVVDMPTEALNDELSKFVKGEIVKILPIKKDCMILSYIPKWQHGNLDNIGVANNGGGVRTLLAWAEIPPEDVNDPNCASIIALYSRKTTSRPPAGTIEAYEILKDWPELTSWETQPRIAKKPAAKFKFVPGKGWKLFDVTPLIRDQLKSKRKCYGLMLRFDKENRSNKDWSGYFFVSREGLGQWLSRHPRFLIVKGKGRRTAD